MALYNHANRNISKEPAFGGATNYPNHMQRPMMMLNKDGGQKAIVSRYASHDSERYVFSSHEEVVEFGRGDDRKPIPPKKNVSMDHGTGDKSPYTPRISTERSNSLPTKLHHPDVNTRTKDKISPPPRNRQFFNTNDHGKYNHLSSTNDISEEGNYKMDAKPKELSYDTEKTKRNGYAPPANYTIPYNLKNDTPDSVNNVYVHPKVKNIPQIKTRIGDPDFAKANTKSPTNYNASPKTGQGYQEVIGSMEARRRYSDGTSTQAGQYAEEMYDGIINCIEAARKYNGVFVTK